MLHIQGISVSDTEIFQLLKGTESVVYRLVLSWVIGLTQWRDTGFIPWFNLIFLLDSVYNFKPFHRVMGTDPALYTEQEVPVAV